MTLSRDLHRAPGRCVDSCQGSVLGGERTALRIEDIVNTQKWRWLCWWDPQLWHQQFWLLFSLFSISFSLFFIATSLSVSFCVSLIFTFYLAFLLSHPVYLVILLGAGNYGLTDGWLKHNWIFLLHVFPKEKLLQWHLNIWKSHGWVANQWGLPHGDGRCPRAAPWLILWSVWLAKWKHASHLTVNCDSFFPISFQSLCSMQPKS